jgi:protein-disulfide isomerase
VKFLQSIILVVLISFGGAAQSVPADVNQRIEREVRSHYTVPPHVKILVGSLKPSEFSNYDALTITFDGGDKKQTFDFLLSKDDKTLIRLTKLDLSKDPYAEVMKKIDVKGRPVRGNKDAKVVVVNYDDFECPYCSRAHQTLFPELLKEYGDRIAFIYKDYPLAEIHPWAIHASVDANCLASQNADAYWEFADYIHANQSVVNAEKGRDAQFAALDRITTEQGQKHNVDVTKLQSCVKAQNEDAVKASIKEGDDAGVSATPTMFINGREVDGALPLSEFRAMFDDALTQAGVSAPSHPAAAGSPGPVGQANSAPGTPK